MKESLTKKSPVKPSPIRTSVIIPNLHSLIIDKTIASIKPQLGDTAEIIIVGMDKYNIIKEDNQVRFLKQEEPKGPAENRNIGIDNARGSVIVFIDADCIAHKDWLKNLLVHHENGKSVVGGSVDYPNNNYWTLCDNISHFYTLSPKSKPDNNKTNVVTINMSVKKDLALKIGKFDERLFTGEDMDFVMKIRRLGYKLSFEPKAIVYHHPDRCTFKSMIKHDLDWAKNSINIRIKYPDLLKTPPKIFLNKFTMILLSPLVAFSRTFKIFFIDHREFLKYWHTIPVVFISKIAWVYGASKGLKKL